jgi:hypothetical protein
MKAKEEKQNQHPEEENSEMSIEELMDIQGGIEGDETGTKEFCGLGCYIGTGQSKPNDEK